MAVSHSYSGSTALTHQLADAQTGDAQGGPFVKQVLSRTWNPVGGAVPTVSGWLEGTVVCAAGDWLLTNADPFQGMGDAVASPGLTIDGSKIKGLWLYNADPTNSVTIIRGATGGCPIFNAASAGLTVQPDARMYLEWPAGIAVTNTTDKLTISVSGGAPSLLVEFVFGP